MTVEILIVDDEADIRELVAGILSDEGYVTRTAGNADAAMVELAARQPQLVILDIWLEGSKKDGLQILNDVKRDHADIPVLMMSGHGNVKTAVEAIKKGAFDFIEKPFESERLLLLVTRALETAKLKRENQELRHHSARADSLIGTSQPIQAIRATIEKVAPTNSRVMIMGAAGTGKEVAARMLHMASKRHDGPFVVMGCASLDPGKLEEKLFGFEDVDGRKVGYLEQAHLGTLFLDEVSDMPLETQAKIVRLLQEQSFARVGGKTAVQVDVRIIAGSNRNLPELITGGKFREDLFYRLNVVPLRLPALSERREDIPALATHFMTRAAEAAGLAPLQFGADAEVALQAYDWPGNTRQLRNVCEWILIMHSAGDNRVIGTADLPPDVRQNTPQVLNWEHGAEIMSLPLREAREVFEREYLLSQLSRFGGNISRTSNFVGMERSALHRKLKLLGISSLDRAEPEEVAQDNAA